MLPSLNARCNPSRPSSIPASITTTKTPMFATTPREAPRVVVGFGSTHPRTIGPRRMPAKTSPIMGDWWTFSIASPAMRAETKMSRRAMMRSTVQRPKPASRSRRLIYALRVRYRRCEPLHGAEGQIANRVQRMGIRRLGRWILPARDAEIRLPEALLAGLRHRRGRLLVLSQPGPGRDEGLVRQDARWVPLHDEDAAADHAREEVEGCRGEPRMVLRVGQGTEGEVRAARGPAAPFHQIRLPLGPHAGLRQVVRDEVPACDRIPAQVVVPR